MCPNLIQIVPCFKPLIANASITNWIADQKALISAFLSTKMLQISLVCDLVDLSKFLAKVYLAFSMLVSSGVTGTILLCKRLLIKSAISYLNLLFLSYLSKSLKCMLTTLKMGPFSLVLEIFSVTQNH